MIKFNNSFDQFVAHFNFYHFTFFWFFLFFLAGLICLRINAMYSESDATDKKTKQNDLKSTSAIYCSFAVIIFFFGLLVFGQKPKDLQEQLFPLQHVITNTSIRQDPMTNLPPYKGAVSEIYVEQDHGVRDYSYGNGKAIIQTKYVAYNKFDIKPLNKLGVAYLTMNLYIKKHPAVLKDDGSNAEIKVQNDGLRLEYNDGKKHCVLKINKNSPTKIIKDK